MSAVSLNVEGMEAAISTLEGLLAEALDLQVKERQNQSRPHVLEAKEREFESPPPVLGKTAPALKKRRPEPPAYAGNRCGDLVIKSFEFNQDYQQWDNRFGFGVKELNYFSQTLMNTLKQKIKDEGEKDLLYDDYGDEKNSIDVIDICGPHGINIIGCREIKLLKRFIRLRNSVIHFGSISATNTEKQQMLDGIIKIMIKLKR